LADLAPLRILTQIALLQLFYYGIAMVLIVFTTIVEGNHMTPGLLFDWRYLRGDVTTGWTLGLCWMLDALITYVNTGMHHPSRRYLTAALLTILTQSYTDPPPHRAQQTGAGLRFDDPLPQPDHHLSLHQNHPFQCRLVVCSNSLVGLDDFSRDLGMSMEGTTTHGFRRTLQRDTVGAGKWTAGRG
jgi:hypothetical protein